MSSKVGYAEETPLRCGWAKDHFMSIIAENQNRAIISEKFERSQPANPVLVLQVKDPLPARSSFQDIYHGLGGPKKYHIPRVLDQMQVHLVGIGSHHVADAANGGNRIKLS